MLKTMPRRGPPRVGSDLASSAVQTEAAGGNACGPLPGPNEPDEGLPPFARHMEETRREPEALANEPDEAAEEADVGSRS
jgi:hypothetical protein